LKQHGDCPFQISSAGFQRVLRLRRSKSQLDYQRQVDTYGVLNIICNWRNLHSPRTLRKAAVLNIVHPRRIKCGNVEIKCVIDSNYLRCFVRCTLHQPTRQKMHLVEGKTQQSWLLRVYSSIKGLTLLEAFENVLKTWIKHKASTFWRCPIWNVKT